MNKEIAAKINVEYSTFENWIYRNQDNFDEFLRNLRLEWKLKKAEENIEDVLEMGTTNIGFDRKTGDTFEYEDPRLKKIKVDTSIFVAETVGKKTYSKRVETTGADGKDLIPAEVETRLAGLRKTNANKPEHKA